VLKPCGHLLSFGSPRTYHRLASGVEDAGFEIRDQMMWVFGSSFPKSHNLDGEWEGWGTALKSAHEPMVVDRKPLVMTVAENVRRSRTGWSRSRPSELRCLRLNSPCCAARSRPRVGRGGYRSERADAAGRRERRPPEGDRRPVQGGVRPRARLGRFRPRAGLAARRGAIPFNKDDEDRCRHTGVSPTPVATVITCQNSAGTKRHFALRGGNSVESVKLAAARDLRQWKWKWSSRRKPWGRSSPSRQILQDHIAIVWCSGVT